MSEKPSFVQPGNVIDLVAGSGGVEVGDIVLLNATGGLAIALASAEEGQVYAAAVEGVFRNLPCQSAEIVEGAALFWTGTVLSTTPSTDPFVAIAVVESAATVEVVTAKLVPCYTA